MRSGPMIGIKTLLCLFICRCHGAPPPEIRIRGTFTTKECAVGETSCHGKQRFTEQEDQFMVEELPIILDDFLQGRSKGYWNEMADKFTEKWKAGTPGFPQMRTSNSLCSRFSEHLLRNRAQVKVPESLKQKLDQARADKSVRVYQRNDLYTSAEEAFIIEEVLNPSYTHFYSEAMWKRIKAKHDEKRLSNTRGFEQERTHFALRTHLALMKKRDQLPKAVKDKFIRVFQKVSGPSTSQTPGQNQQPNLLDVAEEMDEESITEMVNELQNTDFDIDVNKLQEQQRKSS